MDMEKKVKDLLKEVQIDANKAMQLDPVRFFVNENFRLVNGQAPKSMKLVFR